MRKSIFKKIAIIDLPFYPFEKGIELELKILIHICNSIIRVEKSIRRKLGRLEASKDFNFYHSDTIIAVDISSLVSREISHLEHLFNVINLYPFVLINSTIDESRLKKLRLHEYLLRKGYILPVFYQINPADNLYSEKRYGRSFFKLLQGDITDLRLDDIENLDKKFTVEDLISRFCNLRLDGDTLTYYEKICWLGVDDENIKLLLSDLYNKNISKFSLDKVCQNYSIQKDEIKNYISWHRMLFDPVDDDLIRFRFHRNKILLEIKSELTQCFENELYEHSVIDTTETNYRDFKGTFREYHFLGKLFSIDETYSIKLINSIAQSFEDIEFDRVIIVDNGYEDTLKILLDNVIKVPSSRLINNLGNPQLFPFDEIKEREKALIIIDLCNKGDFIKSAIAFLNITYKCQVVGVFSFLIDSDLNILRIREDQKDVDIKFKYYLEKELHNVKDISIKKWRQRKLERFDERYTFFWDTMNQLGSVDRKENIADSRHGEFFRDIEQFKSMYLQRVLLNDEAANSLRPDSDLYIFINDLSSEYKYDACLLNDTKSARVFSRIMCDINKDISLYYTDYFKPDNSIRRFYENNSSILIYDDGLNLGINMLRILNTLDRSKVMTNNNVSIIVLFTRNNMINRLDYIPSKFLVEINKIVNNRLFLYYSSFMPYYLLNPDENKSDERFEKQLSSILEG